MPGMLGMMLAESTPNAAGGAITQTGVAVTPANASAQLRFSTNGDVETAPTSGIFALEYTWRTDLVRPTSAYEVELTPTSGSFSSAAAGSGVFIDLSATRTWARNRSDDTAGSDVCSGTFSIRHVASGLVVANGTFNLTATVNI